MYVVYLNFQFYLVYNFIKQHNFYRDVDVNRNKIKYKDCEGNVIEDVGFQKMMTVVNLINNDTIKLIRVRNGVLADI